jgi:processive 1,2-diacylglycerol beta-glucosyltransferase
MSGGNAIGPLAQALTALAPLREKCQVVAIAGRSERKHRELKEAAAALELNAHILGFVENIHEYMAASDLLVSKAGGLTVAEALVMGLPLVVIRPTPGQEDGNTEFLCRSGTGLNLRSVGALEETVGALLATPDKLEALRQKALSVGRPQAAEEILAEMNLGFR